MNTPTPWKVKKYPHRTPDIVDSNGDIICAIHVTKGYNENAELIVRAANYHDTLVDMVKCLVDNIEFSNPDIQDKYVESWNNALMNARHLLYLIKESK